MDIMSCSNTPQDEAEWICDDWEYVNPETVLSLGNTVVSAGELDGYPVAHEAANDATEEIVNDQAFAKEELRTYPTVHPSKLATENNPTIDGLKLYGGEERTRDDVPLIRSAQTTVHPYAKPEYTTTGSETNVNGLHIIVKS